METFLKKKARAHKYRDKLSASEIDVIIARHVPRLCSIQVFSATEWPEVTDEYYEMEARIVSDVRSEFQKEFMKKIKLPKGSDSLNGLKHYFNTI